MGEVRDSEKVSVSSCMEINCSLELLEWGKGCTNS